jgi:molybdenum cofactor biosynthesis protein MoaC
MDTPSYATRDISSKGNTLRTARAAAEVILSPATIQAIQSGTTPKADPLSVAKVAGLQAAKQTSALIPHCHPVPLDSVALDISVYDGFLAITAEVKAVWHTGVEMEALTAVSVAALTLYDMLKIIDEKMEIRSVRLIEKKGGKSSIKETAEGLTAAVLVLSDSVSKGERKDRSGMLLVEFLRKLQCPEPIYRILPDDRHLIEEELRSLADKRECDLIITTGGTGVSMRDVTPEATLAVIDRRLDGVEETLRRFGQERVPTAMLSRGIVGMRRSTLIINLPGSPGGVEDGFNAIFPAVLHTFRMLLGEGH